MKSMKKVLRCKQLALLLAMLMVVLAPMTVKAAPPPTTTGVTQDNFDAKRYADTYADLKKAFGYNEALLWQHYLQFGIKEGRQVYTKSGTTATVAPATTGLTQANFDYKRYADTYADLKKAFGYDAAKLWQHYQTFGIKEGRQAFAKGAAATAVAPAATAPAAPAPASSNFLTKEGGYDIARYAVSLGVLPAPVMPYDVYWNPGGGYEFSVRLPAGWKADMISFVLWGGKDYWTCRAWNTKAQVPPIAESQARTLAEAQAFFNRFKP